MSRFKLPKHNEVPEVDPAKVEAFAAGATEKRIPTQAESETLPWLTFDPKARPTSGLNLRMNDYELALVRYIAQAEDRSMQKIIKRLLVPALEEKAQELTNKN